MQNWVKLGRVYENHAVDYTHASLPLAYRENENIYTIFYSARNRNNQSLPFSLRLDLETFRIIEVNTTPLLFPGQAGEFDADGVMPTCLVKSNEKLYLVYIGWNRSIDVPFRNALGIAVSTDNGRSFNKVFSGPILDRSIHDPCFVASCDILKENDRFRMWYLSGLRWEKNGEKWRHYYHIKSASSTDLIHWDRKGDIAIDFRDSMEYAISTPRVIKNKSGLYRMWYSARGSINGETYRIGYAESKDGYSWVRNDAEIALPLGTNDWDSDMICYPFVFEHKKSLYMLYNGNGYGKTGFGIAVLKDESDRI